MRRIPRVVFRCDATASVGGGHLRRCLTLAAELRADGWDACFAVSAETAAAFASSLDGWPVVSLPNAPDRPDEEAEAACIGRAVGGCDALIVDHYRRGDRFEAACRRFADRIVVIDDLADRPHVADLIVDPTPGRLPEACCDALPTRGRVLCGPSYAPLRPSFRRLRPASLGRRRRGEVQRLLIAFGATDPGNLTAHGLLAAEASGLDLRVDVVLGSASPHLPEVRRQVSRMPRARLWVDTERVATLMAMADVALGAGGTGTWERCCLGLPSIVAAAADNQRETIAATTASGAVLGSDGTATGMARRLVQLATDRGALQRSGQAAAVLCDGLGARRLTMALRPETTQGSCEVILEPVSRLHRELIHRWQCQPHMRRHATVSRAPAAAEHATWFDAQLRDPCCLYNLIVANGRAAGFLHLRQCRAERSRYRVSIGISAEFVGLGLAVAALRLAQRLLPDATFEALIKPGNTASLRAFHSAGYRSEGDLWLLHPPSPPGRAGSVATTPSKPQHR
jgi:UDP-2,4-diacetamido-2,4,6-trideoxy-beta-L-altropyranose hydrolase